MKLLTLALIVGGALTLGGIYWASRPAPAPPKLRASRPERSIANEPARERRHPVVAVLALSEESGGAMSDDAERRGGGLGRLCDQPWFRPSEPDRGRGEPGAGRRAGDDQVALESLRALARAAEAAGGAGAYVSDAGAVNPPGDSAATDRPATLELAARCHAEAMARLDDEVARWSKSRGLRPFSATRRPFRWWPPGAPESRAFS